jgi:hypothetical protein
MSDEAGVQVGGVGAVLAGLLRARAYHAAVRRTLLAGPLPSSDEVALERLTAPPAEGGVQIAYSSRHGIYQGVEEAQRAALHAIEQQYGVLLLYGTRRFGDYTCELLLADVQEAGGQDSGRQQADLFKFQCWEHFGLDSLRHSASAEYNRCMALAPPLLAAIETLTGGAGNGADDGGGERRPRFLLAHDWAALPLALAAQIRRKSGPPLGELAGWCTVFYAHETTTARRLVEEKPGHDTAFYNALQQARTWNLSLEAVYGSQEDDHRHALLRLATRCDAIFTVGDVVADELRFLGGRFANANIEVVYNGSSAPALTLADKAEAKARLQQYAQRLLGYQPDYIFTHVARLVVSKAFWRDLRLLDRLEGALRKRGQRAVLFVLATSLPAGRRPPWVYAWEEQYGWPVTHRDDNGDLVGLETGYYRDDLLPFNARNQAVQAVLVNQWGWSRDRCGVRMAADMTFADIRRGSDVEFGQSIYEPFGIPQVEALAHGGLCCLSSMCGCISLAARAAGSLARLPNLVIADYVTLPHGYWVGSPYDALNIDRGIRDWIEGRNSERAAHMLLARLPQTDDARQALLESGGAAAQAMGWETVVASHLLPALHRLQN